MNGTLPPEFHLRMGDWPAPAKPLVSVLTPTIPERKAFLRECKASVKAQTFRGFEHIIVEDTQRIGNASTVNECAEKAQGEWLFLIADDDLLLPGCLESHLAADGDIVYSPPLVTGNEDRWWFYQEPPVIPAVALIRAELWRDLGGYNETLRYEEDRDLWERALDTGAVFTRVEEPCWVYRQHAQNKSFNKVAA
jgi:glycosyltransferase involved in cell wall biosynthesis